MIIPNKLKVGDEVRVVAPSTNINILNDETISIATKRLEDLGLVVTFAKNIKNNFSTYYGCSSITDRVSDLHDAFSDKNVKAILCVLGGFNVNQLLDYLDFDLIKNNPKIICGYSDITALCNAITTKTGLVTYHGPFYSSFGMKYGFDYTLDYFKQMLMEDNEIIIQDSYEYRDESWFINQEDVHMIKHEGRTIIHEGVSKGTIVGGNLCTLNLLQGTEYMLKFKDIILFIEDDKMAGDNYLVEFDRNLVSLLMCMKDCNIRGIVIGRAQKDSTITVDMWKELINSKKELENIPVIVNVDFGHTMPMITFPIGGEATINNGEIIIKG